MKGDCVLVRPVSILAALVLLVPLCAIGADRSDGRASPFGTGPESFSGAERAPADSEAQLREIESTKRLMKELGALHGGGGPMAAGAAIKPTGPSVSGVPTQVDEPAKDSGGDLTSNPALRETVKAVNGAVNQVTGGGAASSSAARSNNLEVPQEAPRTRQPGDEERLAELLNGLVDEMLPWALGFGVLFVVGYGGISLVSGRSGNTPGASSSRGRHRSRRSGGAGRAGDGSGRRHSRSSRSGRHPSASDSRARPPSA
jgi:hypothetical protein